MSTPSFDWLDHRAAGLLLHPTCLPGNGGIGTLGSDVHTLLDFIVEAGLKYWQVCPLGPTGFGDSPYQCFSAFAGNPYLIDTQALVEHGLLEEAEQAPLRALPNDHVDYGGLYQAKWPLLRKAFERYATSGARGLNGYPSYASFEKTNAYWLDAYAAYMALKDHFDGQPWSAWEKAYQSYAQAAKTGLFDELRADIDAYKFYQYVFFSQWEQVKAHANERGVQIIGDMPIFVSFDSADLWANKSLFQINAQGKPSHVAGVPPDYFSETGQLWGNPLYNWKALKESGYEWWLERFAQNFALYDVVRLDHFRGFYDYWKIPATAKDARQGKWTSGPKTDFFNAVKKRFGNPKIIAEDLGDNMTEVFKFRDKLALPGMAILQFAFGGGDDNPYLPHNLKENSVVYPGTHDNDTTRGWFESASDNERNHALGYLGTNGSEIAYDFIRTAYKSQSRLAIVALQDFMDLPTSGRFNTPGTAMGNWQWRYPPEQLERLRGETTAYLKTLARENRRLVPIGSKQ